MGIRYTGGKPEKEVFQVIGDTFRKLFDEDSRVVYLDADLMGSLKTQDLWHEYPNNVFNTGIQEANMIGVACGMYLNGMIPYAHSFSPFASRRSFDQIFISGAYANKSIRIIASDAGIMATHNGGTHMCFEDVAMMRTIPNVCLVDISDPHMMGEMMLLTKEREGVSYLRTPRRDLPDIYEADEKFDIGHAKILKEGTDVTLVGCGIMVRSCLEAADILQREGVSARVIDIVTIAPLDQEAIIDTAKRTGAIISAENASIHGGLGSAISECLVENYPVPMLRVGINDQFGSVGSEDFLRQKYGLTPEQIVNKAKKAIIMKN